MTTDAKSEMKRGFEEASGKFELLRATWPKAFPARSHEVRPLTNGAQQAMVESLGWSSAYAQAVLTVWKLRPTYCKAILLYPKRINLDGSLSGEEIDDRSRALAKLRLEESAARQAKKAEQQRLRAAAEAIAQPQAPEPTPAPTTALPDTKPEPAAPPEPPKPRKLLVAGSARDGSGAQAPARGRRGNDGSRENRSRAVIRPSLRTASAGSPWSDTVAQEHWTSPAPIK
jgi:sRNA-binding protein